jgi:RNA 2',3'-cyclic 3'-phosphodiesterase
MTSSAAIRTFFAFVLGEQTRLRLESLSNELASELKGFKWTKPDQLHVTLAFLGDVESSRIADLESAVTVALRSQQPFEVQWRGLGAFPKAARASILWAGVGEGTNQFVTLQRAVADSLIEQGFPSDPRFTPHVTLARAKRFGGRPVDLRDVIERFHASEFGVDLVSEVVLMKSDCRPTGSVYTPIATLPLGGQ